MSMPFGSKTKLFAVVWAVVSALETSGVIPEGTGKVVTDLVQIVAQAGVLWGFRDALK